MAAHDQPKVSFAVSTVKRTAPASWRMVRGALLVVFLALLPRFASAVELEIFVDVDTEEDLQTLLLTEQISDQTFQSLIELHRRGTDLNRASREDLYALPNLSYRDVDRILEYRDQAGRINDPADLVAADVLSLRKVTALVLGLVRRRHGRAVGV